MPSSALDIAQFSDLTENFKKDPALIRRAIRMLLQQQFVFSDDRGCRDVYGIVSDYECTNFFESYFACAGYHLTIDRQRQVLALMPPNQDEDGELKSMRVDESIAMLLCKAEFDRAIMQGGRLEAGSAKWHTDALYDAWREATSGREPPGKGRILEILRQLKNRNLIGGSIPPAMADGISFLIKPSIAIAVTSDAVQTLLARAKSKRLAAQVAAPSDGQCDEPADGNNTGEDE